MKTVHRVALPGDGRSMWYDREGKFSPINETLESFPMPWDEQREVLDREGIWLSSVDDPTLLETWFPEGLLDDLKKMGFVERKFLRGVSIQLIFDRTIVAYYFSIFGLVFSIKTGVNGI